MLGVAIQAQGTTSPVYVFDISDSDFSAYLILKAHKISYEENKQDLRNIYLYIYSNYTEKMKIRENNEEKEVSIPKTTTNAFLFSDVVDRVIKPVLQKENAKLGYVLVVDAAPAVDSQRLQKQLEGIRKVREMGGHVIYVDQIDHASPELWDAVRQAGAVTVLAPETMSYASLLAYWFGPVHDVGNINKYILFAAAADKSYSVIAMMSREDEELLDRVSAVFMTELKQWIVRERPVDVLRHGDTGALVEYSYSLTGGDFNALIQWLLEFESKVPPNKRLPEKLLYYESYGRVGFVSLLWQQYRHLDQGLSWRIAGKLCRDHQFSVCVALSQERDGYGVTIVPKLSEKHLYADIIEEVARAVAEKVNGK